MNVLTSDPAAPAPDDSPFHEGEQRLQTLTGRRDKMEGWGRTVIRDHMPDQHRAFFAMLPCMVVGGLDGSGQPWATLWCGPPGFMQSPEAAWLAITAPESMPGDPLLAHWREGAPVGMLGIQPHTGRRNRLNGILQGPAEGTWRVKVSQSFGNCAKYIRPRLWQWAGAAQPGAQQQGLSRLSGAAARLITAADTVFIASASPDAGQPGAPRSAGVDVSHRGGPPGFVQLQADADETAGHTLLMPDYSGNFMFNTLGNILLRPEVGLLCIDFDRGDVLWLAAHAEIDHNSPLVGQFEGAQRLLHLHVTRWILRERALPLRCTPTPA